MKTRRQKSSHETALAPHNNYPPVSPADHLNYPTRNETIIPAGISERRALVEAKIDVGLGNALFIRGEGEGLSWEKGQPLTCIDRDKWVWSSQQTQDRTVFKLLLNDQIWAQGEDAVVEPGRRVEIVPHF